MSKRQIIKKSAIDRKENNRRTALVCASLVLLALIVFWQLRNGEFIHYDDNDYIVENENVQKGLTPESIGWAFTTGHASNWHPVTWLSHMLDWQLFRTSAGGYHMVNVLLHVINSLLVFLVFKRMTKGFWQSAFVAGIFAIHPGHVESVAWVSERKDVLSTMFWLLTMWAYLHYAEKRSVKWYLVVAVIFAVGLMAKPMLVTLPFVLLLLDYWPLGRLDKFSWPNLRRLVFEKTPLFLLAAGSSVVTYFVQQKGGAMVDMSVIAPTMRIANSVISYVKYIGMMVWPTKLGIFYPYSWNESSVVYAAAGAVLLAGITVAALRFSSRHKYLAVGWLWYIGTLVPVIGLVQVGMQSMADRYTYMPFIGLSIMVAWGVGDLSAKWRNSKPAIGMLATGVILVLTACSWVQAGYWHDSVTLFEHTLKVTETPAVHNGRIHNNLSVVYNRKGDYDKALEHGLRAVQFDPDSANSHYNLGTAYFVLGQIDKAINSWLETVRLDPNFNRAHNNLGALYYKGGQIDLAIKHFQKALEINPKDVYAQENLNAVVAEKNRASKKVK